MSEARAASCDRFAPFADALRRARADATIPSAIAAVWAPRRSFWWAAAESRDGDVTPDTPFRIASTTKSFVAASILRLCEKGALDLAAPIEGLLPKPYLATLTSAGFDVKAIRVDHLLTHTSGLHDHASTPRYHGAVFGEMGRIWTPLEQLQIACDTGFPIAAPGAVCHYSDTGYVLLGSVIERVTALPLGPAVRELLAFDRLGLDQTYWERLEVARGAPRARQYMREIDATDLDPSFDLFGGGGLVSTVGDLARFARALVRGEVFAHPGTLAAGLVTPVARRAPDAKYMHSRLGMTFPMGSATGLGHAGFWGCVMASCPEHDITIAATINQPRPQDPDALKTLVGALMDAALALT